MELGELCTLLQGCLRHLRRGALPLSLPDADLMKRLFFVARSDMHPGHSVAELEQQGVLGLLADLGAALAEWGNKNNEEWSQANPAYLIKDAWLATIALGCGSLALLRASEPLPDGDLLRWARGAGALEGAGRRAMHAVLTTQAAGGEAYQTMLEEAAELANHQLRVWIPLFSLLEPRTRAVQVFAATVMPPPKMTAWLLGTARMMALARTAGCATGNAAQLYLGPCRVMFTIREFRQHQEAAAADPVLLQQLADLLSPALNVAKEEVLRVMAEEAGGTQRSATYLDAQVSFLLAALETLNAPAFRPALRLILAGDGAGDALQAVAEAVELSVRLPPGEPAARGQSEYAAQCAVQRAGAKAFSALAFCTVCRELEKGAEALDGEPEPSSVQAQAAVHALRLLPSLATAVEQLASTEGEEQNAAAVAHHAQAAARMAYQAARQLEHDVPHVRSAAQHAALIGDAARALLRLACAAMALPPGTGGPSLEVAATTYLGELGTLIRRVPAGLVHDGLPNLAADTLPLRRTIFGAACHVHTSLCSWVHRLAAAPGASALLWGALVIALDFCLNACADAYALLGGRDEENQRVLLRAAATHCCAIVETRRQGVAISTHDDTLESLHSAASAALAAQLGSPWLDDPEAWSLVAHAIPLIPRAVEGFSSNQVLAEDAQALAKTVISVAGDSPRFAARLARLDGALSMLAEHACGERPAGAAARASRSTQPSLSPVGDVQVQEGHCREVVVSLARAAIIAVVQQRNAGDSTAPMSAQAVTAAEVGISLQPLHLPARAAEAKAALLAAVEDRLAPLARQLAPALQEHWQQPEQRQAAAMALARAAATRACANLRCPNAVACGDDSTARQPASSRRCSGCRVARYCGTECSHADWRAGHRRVCKALAAAQAAEQERDA